ncbi:general secretion pathway protein GspI [Sorangium cellulosum]|uniref:General secretion pathway protein GspI n=1 Tax=Sorangium cellulosum TaxID=56 RepID=A0A2L0FCA7_SORCE|nr:prepilin-type N-terminal cleavage/methylation domain-containing protein [Sorangium cellulosum]AUX49069.1 general secretion pathway protein GspI [Sorangium cellulosum]
MTRARGFTLLEVMVAVAILGLGLTAILSAQAGAFSAAAHARNLSLATGLARCKMTELEERLAKDGLPALDEADSGPCCEDDDSPHIKCSWRIEKPEMPEPNYGELDLDTDLGALGELAKPAESSGTGASGNISDLAQSLVGGGAGGGDAAAAGGMAGLLQPFMDMLAPTLQPIFEASARRVTVKLTWQQGAREHALELVQWVTIPQMGNPEEGAGGQGQGGGD